MEDTGCPLEGLRRWSIKLYDDFAPVRELIGQFPELKEPIVQAIGEAMTQSFASNFYEPTHLLKGNDESSNT